MVEREFGGNGCTRPRMEVRQEDSSHSWSHIVSLNCALGAPLLPHPSGRKFAARAVLPGLSSLPCLRYVVCVRVCVLGAR